MSLQFLNDPEDCQWLRETALRGYSVPDFASFMLEGHEDCPLKITLYKDPDPNWGDVPVALYTLTAEKHSNLAYYTVG